MSDLVTLLNSYFHIIEQRMESLQASYTAGDSEKVRELLLFLDTDIAAYLDAEKEGGAAGQGYFHRWYSDWAEYELEEIQSWIKMKEDPTVIG